MLAIWILSIWLLIISWCGKTNNIQDTNTKVDVKECIKGCNILYTDAKQRQSCIEICNLADKISSDDIEDCKNITDTNPMFITQDICIQSKAIQMKKPEYCDMIEDVNIRDGCFLTIAEEINDRSLCDKIENVFVKMACEDEDG